MQALLPVLATYLGHARYSDTAYYVTGTADLLGLAADRALSVEVPHELALLSPVAAGILLSPPDDEAVQCEPLDHRQPRDALRMPILFAAEHTQRKPCALTVADLDRDLVLAFLDNLEQTRKNTIQTRNARLVGKRCRTADQPGLLRGRYRLRGSRGVW